MVVVGHGGEAVRHSRMFVVVVYVDAVNVLLDGLRTV